MFSLFATNSSLELGLERGSDRGASLATGIARLPFGPIRSMNLRGGALPLTRTFDQRYQLNRIQAGSIDIQYTRDAAGQVTNVTGIAEPTLPVGGEAYTVNSANNQMTARGNVSYTYDAAGNLTSDGTRTFIWDALGRLKQVQQGNQTVATYGYDIQNRRFRKSVGSTTTYYLYNLDNQLIAELSGNGTVLREYVWLDGQPLVLAEYTGANAGVYFYLNDHLGTPQQLLNGDTGAVAWQAAYLPFGEVQISVNTVTNNLRFPEQYYDAETGLHYNWNRYYDPASGRYVSADPIGLEGGINLYRYVGNNSVNFVDIVGLFRWHGNWGGPDWTAGQEKSWNDFPPEVQADILRRVQKRDPEDPVVPIDKQDELYMCHDIDYGDCRKNCAISRNHSECENRCFNEADYRLALGLVKLGIEKPYWLKVWITAPVFVIQPGARGGGFGDNIFLYHNRNEGRSYYQLGFKF